MYIVLLVIMVILAVLLCFVVTIQNSKGGGLAAGFSSSNQIMGVRKTTDFLEKSTWTLMAAIAVLSIISAYLAKPHVAAAGSVMQESAQEQMLENPATTPAYDAPVEDFQVPAQDEQPAEPGN